MEQWLNITRLLHKTRPDLDSLRQFGKKVLPVFFFAYALIAENLGRGDIMVADIKELQKMDASEIYTRRINALEVLVPQTGEHFMFTSCRWYSKIVGE